MHCTLRTAAALAGVMMITTSQANEPPGGITQAQVDPAMVSAIVEAITTTGALDKAIDEGIARYIEAMEAERQEAQAKAQREAEKLVQSVRRPDPERDHILGDPETRFALIEYSDFECPYCKTFHAEAIKLVANHPGETSWTFRHLPLDSHNPLAVSQAIASECAARLTYKQAFWDYAEEIFRTTTSGGNGMKTEQLTELAVGMGIDAEAFNTCLASNEPAEQVRQDTLEAARIGIQGTPGNLIIDNQTGKVHMLRGAVPYSELAATLDKLR